MKRRVLIVKLGYLETVDHRDSSDTISLGDIFRTTAILHLFKNSNVTWLTTKKGKPLLMDNPYIKRILTYDTNTASQLQQQNFDILINLERDLRICALIDSIPAHRRYGFGFDKREGIAKAYELSYDVLANSDDQNLRRKMKKYWIQMLYEMIGAIWGGEGYVLGYKPRTRQRYDIGFNIYVNKHWKSKAWPREYWHKLEELIGNKYSISYQKSLNDIYGYIDWLNSNRLIITNDSLGLHLSIALRKKIIALFGPTSEKEVYLFGRGQVVRPFKKLKCRPCFNTVCRYNKSCMYMIKPESVYKKIIKLFK